MPPRAQPYPQTPGAKLWAACRDGDLRAVRALIAAQADPNAHASTSTGSTALHEAMLAGHREAVQALLAAGALVSPRDSHGNTPLHACAASSIGDDPELCAQLLALPHCDARAVNSDGATALHLAALRAKPAMAKLLVEHGAPLHGLDRHGRDALTFAADVATERMLLELLATEVLRAEKEPKEPRWPSATPWHLSQVPATTKPSRGAPDRLRPPPRNVEPPPPPPPPPPRSGKPGPPGPKRYGANGQELPEAGAQAAKSDGARSEHERLVRAFLTADVDGSGAVSKRELQRILVAVGVREEATRLFKDADVNRDGELHIYMHIYAGRDGEFCPGRPSACSLHLTSTLPPPPPPDPSPGKLSFEEFARVAQKARPLLTHPAAQQAPVNLGGGGEAEVGMGKQVRAKRVTPATQCVQAANLRIQPATCRAQTASPRDEACNPMHGSHVWQVRAKLRRAFVAFDTDGSGSISLAELEAAFRQCGIFVPDAALKRMFRDADVDRSGAIELAEFEALARRQGLQAATLRVLQAATLRARACNPTLQPHVSQAARADQHGPCPASPQRRQRHSQGLRGAREGDGPPRRLRAAPSPHDAGHRS